MILTILFGLTGCGEVTLTDRTIYGLTLSVPDDFGDFAENEGVMLAANKDLTATMAVSATQDAQGTTPADWSKDIYTQTALSEFTDVNYLEFDTQATVSGKKAVYPHLLH